MGFRLMNACVIAAVQALTGNRDWAPDEVVEQIQEHNGYPPQLMSQLGKYAPVRVWPDGTDISADERGATIAHGREKKRLKGRDKVAVGYITRGGKGSHMEAVEARHLADVMQEHHIAYVVTVDEDRIDTFTCPRCIGECIHGF